MAQDVKKVVDRLKAAGRPEAMVHNRTYRPWGYYESLIQGDRFQVKRIVVTPGRKLSLQSHYHRAEHWVVVNGTARVTRDQEVLILRENESIYLPLGCVHRLENPGKIPADADRGAVRRLSGRGRHRPHRGHLRPGLTVPTPGILPDQSPPRRADQPPFRRASGGMNCGSVSHGNRIQVSCDTSVTKLSTTSRPAGLA